ncbi:internal virion protein D [Pectobacterium phage Jarilo]|uniref:Peptidoglycan transglycosylase gp16 n=1 Tax=Pectobacterium phage Jarilo TaxID=2163634 RepID=A0A2S1GT04_9CAUD|nr:internal virion protein with endolysin domain [Pectobacterium phage Jarilo]AWD92521.1 internal virion protein D [Pectobacterium phage Jarilo]
MSYDKTKASQFDGLFQKAADTHGVSYDFLRKTLYNESSFNPNAKSKTGPKGIAQFTTGTARALGLNARDAGIDDPLDDRYNPELAIDAAARHMSDLVRKYDGDELKAALAYNQGEGTNGASQIEAYENGDYSKISPEGRNYMRNLMDVASSPRKGSLEAFGGINPPASGIPASEAFKGLSKAPKVTQAQDLPQSTGISFEGVQQAEPNVPFTKDFWSKTGTTMDEMEKRSTFFGFGSAVEAQLDNSALGVAVRAARVDDGYDVFKDTMTPTKWNSYTPTPEDIEKLRNSKLPPSYYNVVTGGNGENWDELIKLAERNYATDQRAADAGMGAKLAAGVVGAGVDPLSYVPLVGIAGKGIKVVNKALIVGSQTAALGVASEALRSSVAGGDAHYADAALGGLIFGAGMSAVTDVATGALRRSGSPESELNEFAASAHRMEGRETAINNGSADPTLMNTQGATFTQTSSGVQVTQVPNQLGAVALPNGAILSGTNPTNPQTIQQFAAIDPERAAPGIKLGGFTEIGLKVLSSDTPEVRGLASDLVRSPTGMQSGSSGKFGPVASDIHERLHATDQRTYNQLYDAARIAMDDPKYTLGAMRMSREEIKQDVFKTAALAIENPSLQANLSKAERDVMGIIKAHFDTKRELMENPAAFGDGRAVSIFPDSRHKGTYVPNVYDRSSKVLNVRQWGADGLQEMISKSWLSSYHLRPATKARVDDYLAELNGLASPKDVTPEMVVKHSMDKAYGISHTDDFTSSSVIDDNITGLVGIENNSFLEARNLFDSDVPITLPNGETFSVNDLRTFDMGTLMPAYDRRVNGDIAIMGGTGKTTVELKDAIMALDKKAEGNGKLKGEVEALKDTVKILTGRARRNQDGAFETLARGLNDLTFFSKNFYMGPQNITEISGMVAKGNVSAVLHGIPVVRDLATRTSPVSASELKDIHSALFGRELDDLIRPKRIDVVNRLREASDTSSALAQVVGTFKFGTQELAARSPWTKTLNGTANYILDASRQGVLGDVAKAAFGGKGSKFGKDNFLKSASISQDQWKGIKQLFLDHATRGPDGQFTITNKKAFSMDPRAMDLWRLADKVADETMLRPHKVSNQDSVAYNAGVKMIMQFKNFTIKSLNSKFIRSFYESTKNNRAIDMALTHVLSLGIAAGYFAMQAHVKAYSLQEHQRKDYLKKALNPTMLGYAAVTRSSHLGAPFAIPSMIAGAAGFQEANMLRSTILPKDDSKAPKDKAAKSRAVAADIMGSIGAQIPSVGYIGSVGATALNAAGVLNASSKPTERDYMTGLMNSTRELVPNDPLTQQLLMRIYEANGVYIKAEPKAN